ncbi:putative stress response RCI peptide [Xylariaceae sp. FL0255]|nr:putative stress response RCI peptide [Xylariaceae sp. FL0255]
MCGADIFLGLIAILFPPLAVWVKCGICSADSIINILLCVLGYIPGLLHAWYIIAKFPDASDYESVPQDHERGERVYVFVPSHNQQRRQQQPKPPRNDPMNYGSTNNQAASSSSGPSDERAPPTYAEAVKGDNKIQSQD